MTNFFVNCTNKTKAYAMLSAWMFALISGVTNACLMEPPGAAINAKTATHSAEVDVKHISLSGHFRTEASSAETDDAHMSKQPCLKVCDDSSKSLVKKYLPGQMEPGSPIVVAVLWSLIDPIRLQYKQLNGLQHAVSLLPLRVLYARLAL